MHDGWGLGSSWLLRNRWLPVGPALAALLSRCGGCLLLWAWGLQTGTHLFQHIAACMIQAQIQCAAHATHSVSTAGPGPCLPLTTLFGRQNADCRGGYHEASMQAGLPLTCSTADGKEMLRCWQGGCITTEVLPPVGGPSSSFCTAACSAAAGACCSAVTSWSTATKVGASWCGPGVCITKGFSAQQQMANRKAPGADCLHTAVSCWAPIQTLQLANQKHMRCSAQHSADRGLI